MVVGDGIAHHHREGSGDRLIGVLVVSVPAAAELGETPSEGTKIDDPHNHCSDYRFCRHSLCTSSLVLTPTGLHGPQDEAEYQRDDERPPDGIAGPAGVAAIGLGDVLHEATVYSHE